MGTGENQYITHDESDALFRAQLEARGALQPLAPPPDIVTRTLRALPSAAPAAATPLGVRRLLPAVAGVFALLLLSVGAWNLFGGAALLGLFGDGSVGHVVLLLHLLTKPLVAELLHVSVASVIGAAVALIGGACAWWWLLRQTVVRVPVEVRQ